MFKLLTLILSVCLLSYGANVIANNDLDQYPKRVFYPQLDYIGTQELAMELQEENMMSLMYAMRRHSKHFM